MLVVKIIQIIQKNSIRPAALDRQSEPPGFAPIPLLHYGKLRNAAVACLNTAFRGEYIYSGTCVGKMLNKMERMIRLR